MKTQHKHLLQRTYLVLVFGFMYLPIAVLIAYSFNENKSRAVFTGFSLKWYASLFHNEMILSALGLSLVLAFVSAIIATVLGTASAYRSTNVLCRFYRLLTQEGLDVTLYATEVEK